MARRRKHTLIYIAAAGVGGWAAYEYLYKPWAAQRAAAGLPPLPFIPTAPATGGTATLPAVSLPPPASGGLPPPVGFTSLGPQYSGVLGACIAKKGGTWSPEKCQQRLNDLVAAAQTARGAIASLSANTNNPNAAGIPAAQLQLAQEQNALANAQANYNAATAAGDAAGISVWGAAIGAHQADIRDLNARIAAASKPVDNSAAIAAYQAALAGYDSDYFNLTGAHLAA